VIIGSEGRGHYRSKEFLGIYELGVALT